MKFTALRITATFVLITSLILSAVACKTSDFVKLAEKAGSITAKVRPVLESAGASDAMLRKVDQFGSTMTSLATAFRNGTDDALGLTATGINFLESLIRDTQLIKDPGKRTLALAFLSIADIALGEISDRLTTSAADHPIIAMKAKAGNAGAVATIAEFARKPRLRCRSAVTGRFEKMDICRARPESTVVERGK